MQGPFEGPIWCYIRALAPRKTLEKSRTDPPQVHFPRCKQGFFDFYWFSPTFPKKCIKNTSSERALPGGGSDGPPKHIKNTKFFTGFQRFPCLCLYICVHVCICLYAGLPPPTLLKNLQKAHQKCRSGPFTRVWWISVFSSTLITQTPPKKFTLKGPYLLLYKLR